MEFDNYPKFIKHISFIDRTQSDESLLENIACRSNPVDLFYNNDFLTYDNSSPPSKVPKIIHGYLFGSVLGSGSYGKVKELVEETTLVKRAVKIVNEQNLRKNRSGYANLEKEIRVMSRLNHKNVVHMIETFRRPLKKKTYIVMEYCYGNVETLVKSLCKRRLAEDDAHLLFTQLIDGLEYIHSYGIVHNDIKPSNLLLSGRFVLKICDFGVAEELCFHRQDDSISTDNGTPAFKAPEVINFNSHEFSGFKIDVWAAGATLYYMICGKPPWEDESQQIIKLFKKICDEPHKIPDEIGLIPEARTLIDWMLEKNPTDRASIQDIREQKWLDNVRGYKKLVVKWEDELDEKTGKIKKVKKEIIEVHPLLENWAEMLVANEYARFPMVNYDAFYPKNDIKLSLEKLYGEDLHFRGLQNDYTDFSPMAGQNSASAPDVSPLKYRTITDKQSRSLALSRRATFFKWFNKKRHN